VLAIDVVVKIGGGLLAQVEQFSAALGVIGAVASMRRIVVVPGGGPFADAVREIERRIPLSDDAAHWMAVLGMDQYAHAVATMLPGGLLVEDASQIAAALDAGLVPVLAPYRWLRAADPLPHSWDVTSDSIAAWICGAVRARRLVLVKPAGARVEMQPQCNGSDATDYAVPRLVDAYFNYAIPHDVTARIVAADQLTWLDAALRGSIEG